MKSHGFRSGEYGGCGTTRMPFLAKKFDHRDRRVTRGVVVMEHPIVSNACLVAREQLFFLVFQEFNGNKTD